jgi:hypothetical protein
LSQQVLYKRFVKATKDQEELLWYGVNKVTAGIQLLDEE